MAKTENSDNHQNTQFMCVHWKLPFDDCYLSGVTGSTIPSIVMYCMDRYRECPVYKKRAMLNVACEETVTADRQERMGQN